MPASGTPETQQRSRVEHVTCLGCGCACDDIGIRLDEGRIIDAVNACAIGRDWFGDGSAPSDVRVDGAEAGINAALEAVLQMLTSARAPLIYLAPELSCESQRAAVALADLLRASLDTISTDTVLGSLLAAQERGRASATLGEIRNRADLLVFWGVDPNVRYPRYWSRYAPEPAGLHVKGRRGRIVISVDVGDARGPADADVRVAVDAEREVALLTATAALIRNPGTQLEGPLGSAAGGLARQLSAARYSALVADPEPTTVGGDRGGRPGDSQRPHALIALAQALNGPSRCALSTLRAGGNRSGADAVLTSQTGFPTAVDFSRGFPVYRPHDGRAFADAALVLGDALKIPPWAGSALDGIPVAVIGPRATTHSSARVAIDTGIAGIHCSGTALRMDDVALPLRPSVNGHRDPVDLIRALMTRASLDHLAAVSTTAPGRGR